jgi:hypothetical protein
MSARVSKQLMYPYLCESIEESSTLKWLRVAPGSESNGTRLHGMRTQGLRGAYCIHISIGLVVWIWSKYQTWAFGK